MTGRVEEGRQTRSTRLAASAAVAAQVVAEDGQILESVRGALLVGMWLRESRLPFRDLLPVISVGVPLLLAELGPVEVSPAPRGHDCPVWYPPPCGDLRHWVRVRHSLELACWLTPRVVASALRRREPTGRGGAVLAWREGPDPDAGVGSLAGQFRALVEQRDP